MAKSTAKASGVHLRLYVAGNAPNSVIAVANARAICDEHYTLGYKLEIVDLMDHPARALKDGIIVTPTLVRLVPAPARKIIGTLSDRNQVLLALGGS